MSPQDATREAMREITPAIIGITLVLTAVFIPMAFASGSVGIIYRQFSISMAISILLSAFTALTLTPALCATLLKPHGIHQGKSSVFSAWFNAHFHRLTSFYATGLGFVLKRTGRMMMIYAALCLALFAGLSTLPSSFYPMKIRVILCPQSSFLLMPRCSGRLRSSIHLKRRSPIGRR